jgi:hypothetical protein
VFDQESPSRSKHRGKLNPTFRDVLIAGFILASDDPGQRLDVESVESEFRSNIQGAKAAMMMTTKACPVHMMAHDGFDMILQL